MPIEIIYADHPSQAVTAKAERDNLWLSAAELAKVSGWELKPEGVCKGGVCVTCRALLTEGKVTMRRNFALEDAELAVGYVLTCQSLPATDTITLDYDG